MRYHFRWLTHPLQWISRRSRNGMEGHFDKWNKCSLCSWLFVFVHFSSILCISIHRNIQKLWPKAMVVSDVTRNADCALDFAFPGISSSFLIHSKNSSSRIVYLSVVSLVKTRGYIRVVRRRVCEGSDVKFLIGFVCFRSICWCVSYMFHILFQFSMLHTLRNFLPDILLRIFVERYERVMAKLKNAIRNSLLFLFNSRLFLMFYDLYQL